MVIPYLLPHVLETSVRRFPDKVAVSSGEHSLTYSSLDTLSDQLAEVIRARGVGKGDSVGIFLPMSLASIVSVFAILKAGACYVPLDPSAPAKRLAVIIRNSNIRTLLSSSVKSAEIATAFSDECPLETIVLVDCGLPSDSPKISKSSLGKATIVEWSDVIAQPKSKPEVPTIETDTACIIYTSGSTGTPKGVMISHRNLLTFVAWAAEYVGLIPDDRVAWQVPLHFDLSAFSIFSTCLAGATIVLIPEKASVFPSQLTKLIVREKITVWLSVPSLLTLLVLYGNLSEHDLSHLRTVIFGGEVFPVKYLQKLIAALPHARYLNWYGATETKVSASFEVRSLDPSRGSPIPIGKARANTEIFAINSEGKKISAPGEKGELYVRGPSVMQGYLGDPQKTSRVLVSDTFSQRPNAFVYKTGDIVTLDPDGNYLYLGRADGMIKTRGSRVEPGEVEAALYAHPAVREAVVNGVPDEVFSNRIRAVVSLHEGANANSEELISFCKQRLPQYMIPNTIEFREVLPKTPTGKIDRVGIAQTTPSR